MASASFLGFDVNNLICGEAGVERPPLTSLACAQPPIGAREGFFSNEDDAIFSVNEQESGDEEESEPTEDVLLNWGMVHGEEGAEKKRDWTRVIEEQGVAANGAYDDWTDEEVEDEEGSSRRVRRRPVDKAWPRIRASDNRNWARNAASGAPVPRLIYVHEDRLRLCFLLHDGPARTIMQSARSQFEKLTKDLGGCIKTSAFKKKTCDKIAYMLPESSWHISCATLISRTTMGMWPSAQGAIALLEDMLNRLNAPRIKYAPGACRVCDDGTMVVALDDGGWTAEFRCKLEESGLGDGTRSTPEDVSPREGVPHMRLAPRHGESSHASSCVALVGRLFIPEQLSEKELGKMRKVLKAFRTRQSSQQRSGSACDPQAVAPRSRSVRSAGSGVVATRGWRSYSQRPNGRSPEGVSSAIASGGGPVTSAVDSSPLPLDLPTNPPAVSPGLPSTALSQPSRTAERPSTGRGQGRSRSMVPFSFAARSRLGGSSAEPGRSGSRAGFVAACDLELSVLSMVREQEWCMGRYILEGEFELESTGV